MALNTQSIIGCQRGLSDLKDNNCRIISAGLRAGTKDKACITGLQVYNLRNRTIPICKFANFLTQDV
jgi:hypothetical protein